MVLSTVTIIDHAMEGNLTWKDGATGGLIVASGVAMATGVGEIAMGVVTFVWDIWNLF